jgi:protoheme IX farnesyltransferase
MIQSYMTLTKPGILFGNALTMIAGFSIATHGRIDLPLLLEALLGLILVMASSCVLNQWIDKKADAEMRRTKQRPLVTGTISDPSAFCFAFLLLGSGIACLGILTNMLTLWMALIGFCVYVGLYSTLKYHTVYGTLIGSVAGAMPPVVGYTAVTNQLDWVAFSIFALLLCWQMPHFFAIGIYRKEEYISAGIPIWPISRGISSTKWQMLWYVLAFGALIPSLTFLGATGYVFLIVMEVMSVCWLILTLNGWKRGTNDLRWAHQMFRFSLIVITVFSTAALLCAVVLSEEDGLSDCLEKKVSFCQP